MFSSVSSVVILYEIVVVKGNCIKLKLLNTQVKFVSIIVGEAPKEYL